MRFSSDLVMVGQLTRFSNTFIHILFLIFWLYSYWCIFGSSQLSPRPMVMLRRGWVLIAILHHLSVLFHFHCSIVCFLFCFLLLFVLHGVFIYCFALYIKTPKNSKVRPSSHKTPSSIPKKVLASSSRSPTISAPSSGPKDSRPRVSTATGVGPRVL